MAKSASKEPSKLLSSLAGKGVTPAQKREEPAKNKQEPGKKTEQTPSDSIKTAGAKALDAQKEQVKPAEKPKAAEPEEKKAAKPEAPALTKPQNTDTFNVQFDFKKSDKLVKERRRSVVINSIQEKKVTSYMDHYGYSFNELMCKLIDSLPEL